MAAPDGAKAPPPAPSGRWSLAPSDGAPNPSFYTSTSGASDYPAVRAGLRYQCPGGDRVQLTLHALAREHVAALAAPARATVVVDVERPPYAIRTTANSVVFGEGAAPARVGFALSDVAGFRRLMGRLGSAWDALSPPNPGPDSDDDDRGRV